MGVGREHLSRNKGFVAKLGFWEKVGVRTRLLGRKERDFEPTLGGTVEKWVQESGHEKGSLG